MSKIVCAAHFSTVPEAAIAEGMLKAHDIDCFVDPGSSVYIFTNNSLLDARLMVREQDLNRAQSLLRQHGDID